MRAPARIVTPDDRTAIPMDVESLTQADPAVESVGCASYRDGRCDICSRDIEDESRRKARRAKA